MFIAFPFPTDSVPKDKLPKNYQVLCRNSRPINIIKNFLDKFNLGDYIYKAFEKLGKCSKGC